MDLTTLANVKRYGNVQATVEDALIQSLVTAYSAAVENTCNQTFSQTVFTNQVTAAYIDLDGLLVCFPRTPIVQSIASAKWRRITDPLTAGQTLDPNQTDIDQLSHGSVIRFLAGPGSSVRGQRLRVQLSYTGGYTGVGSGAYPVPADLEMMVIRLVWWAYKKRDAPTEKTAIPEMGVLIIPSSWPKDVRDGLSNFTSVVPSH